MGQKIKIMLIKRKMTIKQLAEKINNNPSSLSNKIQRDNFSEKELHEIAKALGCELQIDFIMGDENEN